ncbi:MAG: ATP-binding protein [Candidatus Symbiothrix sp.]|jgi:signal transduction histidine kinase|nr:ATP-binding protein [Candidatus Symbiothrix sp.]
MLLNDTWPIQPSFLSLAQGKTEESADFKSDGIYYPDYIRGFLADLSHDTNVKTTLSMFQIVPKNFSPIDENAETAKQESHSNEGRTIFYNTPVDIRIKQIINEREIIRIDSGTFELNEACFKGFRMCHKSAIDFCFRQDSRVGIFADDSFKGMKYPSDEYDKNLKRIIKLFNDQEDLEYTKLKLKKIGNRLCVHYTCRVSLLEETMFPIFAKGQFVACLMLGQMPKDNFSKDSAFNNCPEYIQCDHLRCQSIREMLEGYKIDEDKWNAKLNAIINRIEVFEGRLESKIDHRNNDYIRESFKTIRKEIINGTGDIRIRDNRISYKFYKALSNSLSIVHERFGSKRDGFVRMFALPMNDENNKYIPIGWSNSNIDEQDYISKCKDYVFTIPTDKDFKIEKIENLSKEEMSKIINRIGSDLIQKGYDKQRDTLIIKKLIDEKFSYIIWERDNNSGIIEDEKAYLIYEEALNAFYTMAFQNYAYIRGSFMEYMLETVISETTHESAHFTLPALNVMEHKIDFPIYKTFPRELFPEYEEKYDKFKHYKENVIEQILHLNAVLNRPSIIFNDIILEKEFVQIHPLLYKMKKMMSDKADDRDQKIYYSQSQNYQSANLDKLYFDHAIFNLIDNAIKHGYYGIKIYISAKRQGDDRLIIEVVNYGQKIEEGRQIYKLFERGDNNNKTRGMGLGMFFVDKICTAFRGSVDHKSNEIYPLHIPALYCYKNSDDKDKLIKKLDERDKEKIRVAAQTLTDELAFEVVHYSNFITGPTVFKACINNPTFRNIFTINIPIK